MAGREEAVSIPYLAGKGFRQVIKAERAILAAHVVSIPYLAGKGFRQSLGPEWGWEAGDWFQSPI